MRIFHILSFLTIASVVYADDSSSEVSECESFCASPFRREVSYDFFGDVAMAAIMANLVDASAAKACIIACEELPGWMSSWIAVFV